MPELAEVEFYRKQWNNGLLHKIVKLSLHERKRIFRGTDVKRLQATLPDATLLESKAHGKQMLFRFSKNGWLGIHLGMTGKLTTKEPSYIPQKHDHLILFQKKQALVFHDPRQFGRVLFHHGSDEPKWWSKLPPSLISAQFTLALLENFLQRRGQAPIKAVLLMQEAFPGIGNWMADEILWRAQIHPKTAAGKISVQKCKVLFREVRWVCRSALRIIGQDFSDPPNSWLLNHRWKKGDTCPKCKIPLQHATIGGRTTCWCPPCQLH